MPWRTVVLLIAAVGQAQSFEVASIKLHPGEVTISADPAVRGPRVISTASTLLDMITNAYGVRYDQISGAPNWAGSDHYHVDAKAPGHTPPTAAQARLMMQALLAERFQLKLHRETRQVPVYELVIDKNAPKLRGGVPGEPPGGSMRTIAGGLHMETKTAGWTGWSRGSRAVRGGPWSTGPDSTVATNTPSIGFLRTAFLQRTPHTVDV